MIVRLRRRHRLVTVVLAIAVPIGYLIALAVRRPPTTMEALPAAVAAPAAPEASR